MQASMQQATIVEYAGGRTEAGQFDGFGKAVFSSGQVYEGGWREGHIDGPAGCITFPDGVSYEGDFASDAITGTGVYTWGNVVYEGEVLNGLRHGCGTLTFTDSPVRYEGHWRHGKRHGTGTLFYNADRSAYYEGDWQDDMKQGHGTSVYPGGSSYTGSWLQDMRHGPGTMNWIGRAQVYRGAWSNNLPNGLGEHVWLQGAPCLQAANHAMHVMFNRFRGMFRGGKRHGEGSLWYSNGARYEGSWQQDRKHGQGLYVFEDGCVFAGAFADDRPVLQQGCMLGAESTFAEAATPLPGYSASECSCTCDAATPMAAGDAASAAGGAACEPGPLAGAAASCGGPPGFGPRVSQLQLYIGDLLADSEAPAATYRAVSHLLVGFNTELRLLYDKYSNKASPVLSPGSARPSWALQCGQLWELLRNGQVLSRHLQLQQVCAATLKALEPPPAVQRRRGQVLATADAAAVPDCQHFPFDAATELLFRDFCEVLVRLAPLCYPLLPRLEQQLQQLIVAHLLPLLGSPTSSRQQAAGRQSLLGPERPAAAVAAAGCAALTGRGGSSSGNVGPEQLQQEELVLYLQSQAQPLQQLFAALLSAEPLAPAARQGQLGVPSSQQGSSSVWLDSCLTVRQVVRRLADGPLQRWQLSAEAAAAALLEGVLSVSDPEALRARFDGASFEPSELEAQQHGSAAGQAEAAAAAAAHQELLHWMECPLLLVELLWGLVRCAAVSPGIQAASQPQQGQQQGQAAGPPLLLLVQQLLEGPDGLLQALGVVVRPVCSEEGDEEQQQQQHQELDGPGLAVSQSPLTGPADDTLPSIQEDAVEQG